MSNLVVRAELLSILSINSSCNIGAAQSFCLFFLSVRMIGCAGKFFMVCFECFGVYYGLKDARESTFGEVGM